MPTESLQVFSLRIYQDHRQNQSDRQNRKHHGVTRESRQNLPNPTQPSGATDVCHCLTQRYASDRVPQQYEQTREEGHGSVLVEARHQVPSVVREEAPAVQRVAQELADGGDAHVLAVLVLVLCELDAQQLLQRRDVATEAGGRQHRVACQFEELRDMARLYVEARRHSRVPGDNDKVLSGDREAGAPVVVIRVEALFHLRRHRRSLCRRHRQLHLGRSVFCALLLLAAQSVAAEDGRTC